MKSETASRSRFYIIAVFLTTFAVIPLVLNPREYPFLISTLMWTFFYAYTASAWNILGGYTGVFSFGHVAFLGIGAYTTMLLYLWAGISPWIGMWVAVAVSIAASFMISLPSLRLKGHYFIIVTWVFQMALMYTVQNWTEVTGGGKGLFYKTVDFSLIDFQFNTNRLPYYYIMLSMLVICVLVTYRLQSTKMGYYMKAIREDAEVAAASGINVLRYKVLATCLSAALTSLAGTFYAQYTLYIDAPTVLGTPLMTRILMTAVFGGMGTVMGPTLGSFVLTPLTEYVRAYLGSYIAGLHLILYATILGASALAMPEGILGALSKRGILRQVIGRTVYTPPERITY